MFLGRNRSFLNETSFFFWSAWGAYQSGCCSVSAASLLGRGQHICSSFLSQILKTFIDVSLTPLTRHFSASPAAFLTGPLLSRKEFLLRGSLFSLKRCHSPLSFAWLQMDHSPPDEISKGKIPFLFHRSPSLSALGKNLTYSTYKMMAESEHI